MKKRVFLFGGATLGLVAVIGLASVLAGGCGASKSSYATYATAAETMAASYTPEAYNRAAGWGGAEMAAVQAADYDGEYDGKAYEVNDSGGFSENGADTIKNPAVSGRKLIRQVSMDVETEQFEELVAAINGKITELGGYSEQSDVTGNRLDYRGEPVPRYASITARIPSDKLDSFLDSVEKGGNVTDKSESVTDVTLQYSDVESRKKSLEIEQERLWALLEKAESVDAIISLEERLSDIRYQMESMESQLRLYDNQVDYSTVHLSINEVKKYTQAAPETLGGRIKNGFGDNLLRMGEALTEGFIGIVTLSPFWLPPVAILAIVLIFVHKNLNRKKRNNNTADGKTNTDNEKKTEN